MFVMTLEDHPDTHTPPHSAGSAGSGAADAGLSEERVYAQGVDGALAWYIPLAEAARRVGKTRFRAGDACRAYLGRVAAEERALAEAQARGEEGTSVTYAPRPSELACLRLGGGAKRTWLWVREDTLDLHFVNRVDPATGKQLRPGRLAGAAQQPYHYKPREEDRRYKTTRERLAKQGKQQKPE